MTAPRPPARPVLWRLRVHRTPNYVAFVLTGAVLGFIAGGVVDLVGPPVPTYSGATSLLFLGVVGALVGAMLAGLVAVIVEAALRRAGR